MKRLRKHSAIMIIAFVCEHSAYKAACEAVSTGGSYDPGVHLIPVPCSGRVDMLHILKAFENGADGVLVMGCFKDSCNYVTGSLNAEKRVNSVRKLLGDIGVEPQRLKMCFLSSASPSRFIKEIQEAVSEIDALGKKGAEAGD